jgi:predicted transcriptional regulator of viral defense system
MHMKPESQPPSHIRDYIASLAAAGRYSFASNDAREALGVSAHAAKLALNRLGRHKVIASPARGFYVIIPPEYRSLGCLPADQFVPNLLQRQGHSYYAALLSAAQYHGAAHHRPQEFQVMLAKARRPVRCGQVRVAFIVRKRLKDVAVQSFNTPRGTILVSTPEATAVDLVGYHHHAGGLDQVATILSELAEQIDPQKLVAAARTAPVPWAQRLGYLLEHAGAAEKAAALKSFVKDSARETVPLLPEASKEDARRDADWKLLINTDVEAEL